MESGEQVLVNVSSIREIRQNSVIDMNNNPIEIRKSKLIVITATHELDLI